MHLLIKVVICFKLHLLHLQLISKCLHLKNLATIFLILVIFLQTFSRFAVQADYLINIGYIVKNLCVNKDKPAMHCNGKCYLAKQLKQQEKQEQAPVSRKNNSEVLLFLSIQKSDNPIFLFDSKTSYPALCNGRLASFPRSVFHPPCA